MFIQAPYCCAGRGRRQRTVLEVKHRRSCPGGTGLHRPGKDARREARQECGRRCAPARERRVRLATSKLRNAEVRQLVFEE